MGGGYLCTCKPFLLSECLPENMAVFLSDIHIWFVLNHCHCVFLLKHLVKCRLLLNIPIQGSAFHCVVCFSTFPYKDLPFIVSSASQHSHTRICLSLCRLLLNIPIQGSAFHCVVCFSTFPYKDLPFIVSSASQHSHTRICLSLCRLLLNIPIQGSAFHCVVCFSTFPYKDLPFIV